MDNTMLQLLAKKLNLTGPEEKEEYILTKQEEEQVINHEIENAKKHKAWKLAQYNLPEGDILLRLANTNWVEEISYEEILERANSAKHYGIWQKEQRQKEKEEQIKKDHELKDRCHAKYFFNLMSWASKNIYDTPLVVHDDNKKLITAICFFFSRDKRFETDLKLSLSKGLLIRGISGLGKTHLIKCIQANDILPVSIVSMIEVCESVKDQGEFIAPIKKTGVLYLDDVGTEEPIVNYFGTKTNWFKNFIEMYYLRVGEFNNLIISTNNDFKGLEEKYGFRVRSRIKDMFNIIDVTGKDMRG